MQDITIGEARNNFSRLINNLIDGTETEYVIKNRSKPVARIVPVEPVLPRERTFGVCKDAPGLLDDDLFDALDEEIAKDFGVWV